LHKKLVNTTDSKEPKVKDEDHVEDDVGDLLVKEEHADGFEIPSTVGFLKILTQKGHKLFIIQK
jgi:hypothetical protein